MAVRTHQTLADVAYVHLRARGHGPVKANVEAAKALTTAACLAVAAQKGAGTLGAFPTQTEYARHWRKNERKAQREWAQFREAFPDEDGPERLARSLVEAYARKREEVSLSAVLGLPADGLLTA